VSALLALAVAAAHAIPPVPSPLDARVVECATLPAPVARALCVGDEPVVVKATGRGRTVYFGQDVRDERPSNGPRIVESLLWNGGLVRGVEADTKAYEFLQGLGPLLGKPDALARLRLFAWLRLGLDGAWTIDQDLQSCAHPSLPDEKCGTVEADGVYTSTVLRHDNLSCECSTTWSKVIRDTLVLAPDGTLSATEAQVWCTAWPESANDSVCGEGWKNPEVAPTPSP